jgi:hypothetical protein
VRMGGWKDGRMWNMRKFENGGYVNEEANEH